MPFRYFGSLFIKERGWGGSGKRGERREGAERGEGRRESRVEGREDRGEGRE
jgi:hypothetical protein